MTVPASFFIEAPKLAVYLLNPQHKNGRSKANLLLAHGFSPTNTAELAVALADHAMTFWPGQIKVTKYGQKHVIDGPMTMPDGTIHDMRTVWQIDNGRPEVRFITSY